MCRNVEIHNCPALTDVNQFKGLVSVSLNGCTELVKVAELNQAHSVSIVDCPKIKANDVLYQLDDVARLQVRGSGKIRAVGQLGGSTVQKTETIRGGVRQWRRLSLVLEDHALLRELRGLGSVHTLTVRKCPAVLDATALRNVHTLVLDECNRLRDISALSSCVDVSLIRMPRIDDVRALASCKRVRIDGCKMLTDVSPLTAVSAVWISRCSGITDLKLNKCHLLSVEECDNLQNLEGLVNPKTGRCTIDELSLATCSALESVQYANGARTLTLSRLSCEGNADVDLEACARVSIVDCPNMSGSQTRISDRSNQIIAMDYKPPAKKVRKEPKMTPRTSVVKPSDTDMRQPTTLQRAGPQTTAIPKNVSPPQNTTEKPSEEQSTSFWSWLSKSTETTKSKEDPAQSKPKEALKAQTKLIAPPKTQKAQESKTASVDHADDQGISVEPQTVVEGATWNGTSFVTPVADVQPGEKQDSEKASKAESTDKVDSTPKAEEDSTLKWKDSGLTTSSPEVMHEPRKEPVQSPSLVAVQEPAKPSVTTIETAPTQQGATAPTKESQTDLQKACEQLELEGNRQDEEQKAAFNMYCQLGHDARMNREHASATSFFFKALTVSQALNLKPIYPHVSQ